MMLVQPKSVGKTQENSLEVDDLILLLLLRRKCCIAEVVFQLLQSSVKE